MVKRQASFDDLLKDIEILSEEQKQIVRQRLEGYYPLLEKRTAGLGEGTIWMSDDFAEPLPNYMQFQPFR